MKARRASGGISTHFLLLHGVLLAKHDVHSNKKTALHFACLCAEMNCRCVAQRYISKKIGTESGKMGYRGGGRGLGMVFQRLVNVFLVSWQYVVSGSSVVRVGLV